MEAGYRGSSVGASALCRRRGGCSGGTALCYRSFGSLLSCQDLAPGGVGWMVPGTWLCP